MGHQVKPSCAAADSCCNYCAARLCFVLIARRVAQSTRGTVHHLRLQARQAAQA